MEEVFQIFREGPNNQRLAESVLLEQRQTKSRLDSQGHYHFYGHWIKPIP